MLHFLAARRGSGVSGKGTGRIEAYPPKSADPLGYTLKEILNLRVRDMPRDELDGPEEAALKRAELTVWYRMADRKIEALETAIRTVLEMAEKENDEDSEPFFHAGCFELRDALKTSEAWGGMHTEEPK